MPAVDDLAAPGIGAGINSHVKIADIADGSGNVPVRVGDKDGIPHMIVQDPRQRDQFRNLRVVIEAVTLLLEPGAEELRDLPPPEGVLGAVLVLNIDLKARGGGKIVQRLAGLHGHAGGSPGVGFGETLRDFGVALTGTHPFGDQFLVTVFQQTAIPCERVLQITVRASQVCGEVFRNGAVARVLLQHGLKILLSLRAENRVKQGRVTELHMVLADLRDLKRLVLQVHGIAHLVGRGVGVTDRRL